MNWIIFSLIVYIICIYAVFAFFTWYDTSKRTGLHDNIGLHVIFSMTWPVWVITAPIIITLYFIYEWINKYKKNNA